jgi:peptidoglycan/LPS O-acetylase OafA/YrhL
MDENVRVSMTSAAGGRDPAIDMAKGVAILWVLLIHSDALHQNLLFRHVVNQAVPVFVVLFGLNSTLWWRRRSPRTDTLAWYRRGVRRIMVPVWAALVLWWAMALWFRPFGVWLTRWLPFLHAGGYLLYVGTGWFVTMIIQLVVAYPAFEVAARRVGRPVVLGVGVVITAIVTWLGLWIVGVFGRLGMGESASLFAYFVMSPRFYGHVAFGMVLADVRGRLGLGSAAIAAAVVLGCVGLDVFVLDPSVVRDAQWLAEAGWVEALALTVVLLVGLRPVARVPAVAAPLAWLGQSSYGLYIGQMLTHNFFVYWYGLGALYERLNLWCYTAILLAGGLGFVWLGERLAEGVGIARKTA